MFVLVAPFIVNAQDNSRTTPFEKGLKETGNLTGYDTKTPDPGASQANPVIKLVMPFVGVVYFILLMYAGYLWMIAQGNEDQVDKARKIIVASTIGLLIIMLSYAIAWFVFSTFSKGYIE